MGSAVRCAVFRTDGPLFAEMMWFLADVVGLFSVIVV